MKMLVTLACVAMHFELMDLLKLANENYNNCCMSFFMFV